MPNESVCVHCILARIFSLILSESIHWCAMETICALVLSTRQRRFTCHVSSRGNVDALRHPFEREIQPQSPSIEYNDMYTYLCQNMNRMSENFFQKKQSAQRHMQACMEVYFSGPEIVLTDRQWLKKLSDHVSAHQRSWLMGYDRLQRIAIQRNQNETKGNTTCYSNSAPQCQCYILDIHKHSYIVSCLKVPDRFLVVNRQVVVERCSSQANRLGVPTTIKW